MDHGGDANRLPVPGFYRVVSDGEEPAGQMRSFLAPDVLNQPPKSPEFRGPYKHLPSRIGPPRLRKFPAKALIDGFRVSGFMS